MKQVISGFLMVLTSACILSSCAIGKLEDAAEQLEEVKNKIGELAVAECLNQCSAEARECFDKANNECVNTCEDSYDVCDAQEDVCLDAANTTCSGYEGAAYYNCMDILREQCAGDCDQKFSDCGQGCANQVKDCLFQGEDASSGPAFSQCMTNCIEEIEDTLQEFD